MATIIAIGAILLGFAGFAIWMYARGRQAQRGADALKTDKVQDEQLEAANEPRDPKSVADRLRHHKF